MLRKRWLRVCLYLSILANAADVRAVERTITRTEDVIYGRKYGMAMTLDVFKPAEPNGQLTFRFQRERGYFDPARHVEYAGGTT